MSNRVAGLYNVKSSAVRSSSRECFHLVLLCFEQDWCDGPMRQLLEDKDKRTNSQAIKDCFLSMFENLLSSGPIGESASQIRGNVFGPFRKKFAKVNPEIKACISYNYDKIIINFKTACYNALTMGKRSQM